MYLVEAYIAAGIAYSFCLWRESPKEQTQINHLGDFGNVAVTAIGCALLWPLVAYINHLWKGPKE